jgi:hypothetical protein
MTNPDDTIRVFIPLTFRRRNGRPKILPPEPEPDFQARSQDPHILRALGQPDHAVGVSFARCLGTLAALARPTVSLGQRPDQSQLPAMGGADGAGV